ncbi:glycerophosphodiester phosphodiesterase [Flammeovirga sp. MY04]|uniref:glycerophosphodiester phosphodiesterase n=1 Tax=Flammeovirga sp. MY04 TaxID=1191459 RepID=UPI0008062179|nr:glycerophosphodiester phosphodiesterase [Flammeovirga sp. MY04]ANQ51158.1 glycerophosphodiester phosphodiesterase [Flammeovirga sp. MY04]
MKNVFPYLLILLTVFGCQKKQPQTIDLQGHRGCRGIYPENTNEAFLKALEIGVTTLEMDVVISKDKKVVVSHEPFFSHEIAISPQGDTITKDSEHDHNIYALNYEDIKKYDVGSRPHDRFPHQKKFATYKPLLSEVIENAESYAKEHQLKKPYYNIEIKRQPKYDSIYHPGVEEFAQLVMDEIKKYPFKERIFIQSFDVESLQEVRKIAPEYKTVYLIENEKSFEENMKTLGYIPEVYSPYFELVDQELVEKCKAKNMLIIPWTVNETQDMEAMIDLKVNGIISDYPGRLKEVLEEHGILII